jgi:hypothetical protein
MSPTRSLFIAATAAAISGSTASGAVVPVTTSNDGAFISGIPGLANGSYPYVLEVGLDTGARQDDPSLWNYVGFDLQVSIDSGDHWAGADLRAVLFGSAKYYVPPANDSNTAASVAQRNTVGTRYLRDDTMVFAPGLNGSRVSIVGSSSRKSPPDAIPTFPSDGNNFFDPNDPNGTATNPANDRMLVDVQWQDNTASTNSSTGVQSIARLTFLDRPAYHSDGEVWGYVVYRVRGTNVPGYSNYATFLLGEFVPEPASACLMSLGLGAIALRSRTT